MTPGKKGAAPFDAARSGERDFISSNADDSQPHLALCKLWMRCGPRARRQFLSDVREAHSDLWAEVSKGGTDL